MLRPALAALAAAALGVLGSSCFPPYGVAPAALVAIAVGAWGLRGRGSVACALLAWLFGSVMLATSLWWIVIGATPYYGGGVALETVAGSVLEAVPFALGGALYGALRRRSTLARIAAPTAIFVLAEFARTLGPYGLPFATLGSAETSGLLAGLLPIGGVPCASAAVMLLGLAVGTHGSARVRGTAVALTLASAALGTWLAGAPETSDPQARAVPKIGVVQAGPIDTGQTFAEAVRSYARATRALRGSGVHFVVWPEGVVFDTLADAREQDAELAAAAEDAGVPILVGATVVVAGHTLNVLLEQDPGGARRNRYTKRRTVPIGEAAYTVGNGPSVIEIAGLRVAPLICFEVGFAGLMREGAGGGAEFALAVLNDSHFKDTAGPLWQAQQLRLRSQENGIDAILADAAGPSGLVEPNATPGVPTAKAFVVIPRAQRATPYRRFGEWPFLVMLLVAGLGAPALRFESSTVERAGTRA